MGKTVPGIKPKETSKEDIKLLQDREAWTKQYDHYLARKNKFAAKLQANHRPTSTSKKYAELDAQVKKYWQLLRDSLPAYRQLFNSPHR